jgi:putative transcriptional regulator
MEHPPYAAIEKGTFLIASPEIEEGLFFRSVVLICEHNMNGSFGLVINKPIELDLPEELLSVENMENPHIQFRAGGPVQTNQMMLLHTENNIPDHTLNVCPGVFLGGNLEFLQQAMEEKEGPFIHLCFGYCGWGGGHLEKEFMNGHWFLSPASKHTIFDIPPEKLWQHVLREMGGKYASLSMIPEDLSLN